MLNAMSLGRSITFDLRLLAYEVQCARAHVQALLDAEKISAVDAGCLEIGLDSAFESIQSTRGIQHLMHFEDVSECLDHFLTEAVGDVAANLRLGRARNDVSVTALRLWMREAVTTLGREVRELADALLAAAEKHADSVIVGYSHLQPARPITLGFVCAAHAMGLVRDLRLLAFVKASIQECPLGAGAMSGGEAWLNRDSLSTALGFSRPTMNALDSVGSRDFVVGFLSSCLQVANRLSRLGSEIDQLVELGGIPLTTAVSGSACIVDWKSYAVKMRVAPGVPLGSLGSVISTTSALSLSYFRDLQEDKEAVFAAFDALEAPLRAAVISVKHLATVVVPPLDAIRQGDILAADYAEGLVRSLRVSYKDAHRMIGQLVQATREEEVPVNALSSAALRAVDARLTPGVIQSISFGDAVGSRAAPGGTAPQRLRKDLLSIRAALEEANRDCMLNGFQHN